MINIIVEKEIIKGKPVENCIYEYWICAQLISIPDHWHCLDSLKNGRKISRTFFILYLRMMAIDSMSYNRKVDEMWTKNKNNLIIFPGAKHKQAERKIC